MSTPDNTPDPFLNPAGNAPVPPEAPQFPTPTAPQGYAPMAPPPGYAPIAVPPTVPRSIALWATILTGAYAALMLVSAVLAPATVESLKDSLANPDTASPFAGTSPTDFIIPPVSIASFVLLALWMSKIRGARKTRGEAIGGPPAVEWWGWFVPVANIVLPFLGMRAVTKGRASIGLLLGWWIAFVAFFGVQFATSMASLRAIDFQTGELARPEALDSIVGLTWAAAILLTVSWVFLATIIRITTRSETDAA